MNDKETQSDMAQAFRQAHGVPTVQIERERKRRDMYQRRERVEGCSVCDRLIKEGTSFAPPHDASYGCESGKHSHCSCDTCF